MAKSSDDFDIDNFLDEINGEVGHIKIPITLDLKNKTIHCYLCGKIYSVPRTFRLDETCPWCFEELRDSYLRAHP